MQGKHKDLAKAARTVAGALDRVADIIVARKIAAVGELADLRATVGIMLAFAPVTAGLSTLLAGAKIAATRIAFKRILKEMAEAAVAEIVATLTEPAVAAIENIVADLAIQTALNVAGVQDGYDADRTARAGKDGLWINSAGGPTGPGPGLGGGPEIDHHAHSKTGTGAARAREDGSVLFYPHLPAEGEEVLPLEGDRVPLVFVERTALGNVTYETLDRHSGLARRFTGNPYKGGGLYWLSEVEDRNGNAFRISRGENGLPSTVAHAGGYRLAVSSDTSLGRITGLSLHTPDGPVEVTAFGYDDQRRLEAVRNFSGDPLLFTYDDEQRVTSWTDRNGHTYRYLYDAAGRGRADRRPQRRAVLPLLLRRRRAHDPLHRLHRRGHRLPAQRGRPGRLGDRPPGEHRPPRVGPVRQPALPDRRTRQHRRVHLGPVREPDVDPTPPTARPPPTVSTSAVPSSRRRTPPGRSGGSSTMAPASPSRSPTRSDSARRSYGTPSAARCARPTRTEHATSSPTTPSCGSPRCATPRASPGRTSTTRRATPSPKPTSTAGPPPTRTTRPAASCCTRHRRATRSAPRTTRAAGSCPRGHVGWHARSTVWGSTLWNRDAVAYTPLRLPGQYDDPETGLYYNCFRHYDPTTARYAGPDPLGLAAAPNPIAYVSNPHAWMDPEGLKIAKGCTESGGWYSGMTPANLKDDDGNRRTDVDMEINHIPAKNAYAHLDEPGFRTNADGGGAGMGPAIRMEYDDHRKMISTGSSHKSIKWRADQRALIDAGRWDLAMKMDIDECRRKFGTKYDTHIADMIASLEKNRKFQKMLTKRGWTIDYDILK